MHKLLILSKRALSYKRLIEKAKLPDLKIVANPLTKPDILLGEVAIIKQVLPRLRSVKWVQSTSAGVEKLMDPSLRRDYVLTNARGVFGELMSEYVFGYMLVHERRIFERWKAQQSRTWSGRDGGTLRGKTLGLLGVGSIGAHLAQTAKHFGMQVRGYTRRSASSKFVDQYYHGDDLLEFAKGLDYLVSVLPKTQDTDQIVNADLLKILPSHAIFINVGRGNAVDETALLNALKRKQIAGAILDVTDPEPLPNDHPFWTAPNLLLTFHTSAISYPEDITRVFVENYRLYSQGKQLKYRVNFEKGY